MPGLKSLGLVLADPPNNSVRRTSLNQVPRSPRLDVLIYAEQVRRIETLLDLRQTVVIFAVSRPDAIFALFHHEVDVRPAGGIWMKRAPILLRPGGDFFLVRGVRIDADNHG